MPDTDNISDSESPAAFVFTGKIIKTRAATMSDVPTENTLIAQIEHIVKVPAMFSSITGQQVTVRFKELPALNDGDTITVYANGWIFGDSIAVDAVKYSAETDKKAIASAVQSSMTADADDEIKERIDSAQLGVVGKVLKIEKAAVIESPSLMAAAASGDQATTRISEHDPDWHEATIQVDEVLKGEQDTKQVKVLFPRSDDVRWYGINKYKEGQQGVFLLQKGKSQSSKGIAPKVFAAIPDNNVFTALHSNDYLPLHELGKVKSLINK